MAVEQKGFIYLILLYCRLNEKEKKSILNILNILCGGIQMIKFRNKHLEKKTFGTNFFSFFKFGEKTIVLPLNLL